MAEREENGNNALQAQLTGFLLAIESAGRSNLPVSNDALLRSIAEAAARIFQAAAASILLVHETEGVLEFKVSTEKDNQNLVGMRFPLDQGIAGYVVMTGQPLAISNVEQDARFNRTFAESTGYVPRSILAMPLISNDRILGVMEVLDKLDAASFGMQDMELLGLFAHQAALAIEISQQLEQLGDALLAGLKQLAVESQAGETDELMAAFSQAAASPERSSLLQLADYIQAFGQLGEAERQMALKILAAFSDYSHSRKRASRGAMRR